MSTTTPGAAPRMSSGVCNADLCVCLLDDVDGGQCPSDGVCMDGDAIFDKMASCCDFG